MASRPKFTGILKDAKTGDRVDTGIREYDRRNGCEDERKTDYLNFEKSYYDLVTDFFE